MSAPRIGLRALQQLLKPRFTPHPIRHTTRIQPQPSRFFSTTPLRNAYGRSYSRFERTSNIFARWSSRPTFYYEVGGLSAALGGFYVYNLEVVPVSGRRRFNIFGPDYERQMAQGEVEQILRQFKGELLSDWDPRVRQVKRVINRLIPVCGLKDLDWEVYVVDSPMVNAMVVPGGKVFVFTGILPIARDDDGLAAILGHEISHAVARHVSERLSRYAFVWLGAILSDLLLGTGALGQVALHYALEMPNSRKQETEADYLGLLLMAQACYNPQGAIGFWQRMAKQGGNAPPEFLSSHPAPEHRVQKMVEWLAEAEQVREKSDCAATLGYAREFQQALPAVKW